MKKVKLVALKPRPAIRLKQDWVITVPAGTIIPYGPVKREWGELSFSHVEGIHRDGTAYVDLGISDVRTRPDLFEEVTE